MKYIIELIFRHKSQNCFRRRNSYKSFYLKQCV